MADQDNQESQCQLREMKPVPIKTEPIGRERQETQTVNKLTQCPRCGTEGHLPTTCRFKDKYCNFSKERARVCRNRLQQAEAWRPKHSRRNVRYLEEETTSESEDAEDCIKTVPWLIIISQVKKGGERSPPIRVTMSVNGVDLDFEVDRCLC